MKEPCGELLKLWVVTLAALNTACGISGEHRTWEFNLFCLYEKFMHYRTTVKWLVCISMVKTSWYEVTCDYKVSLSLGKLE